MDKKYRIWEIDFLRGIAFLFMVYDHVIFDLNSIFGIRTNFFWGYDDIIGNTSALIFMILCGISTTLSKNPARRGGFVLGAALMLSAVTYIVDIFANSGLFIKFGILHLLGVAMILSYFVKKLPNFVIILISAAIYALSYWFNEIKDLGNALFFIGIRSNSFSSGDYYPLVPFLAFVFVGIVIGKTLYKEKKSIFKFSIGKNPFSFIGKHSLIIYLMHQPVIIAIMYIIFEIIELFK